MSYSLKLGTFNKHIESTKQPNVAAWTNYDVVFKDGADIVNPTVVLSISYDTVKAYNYGYMLDRYYWVENIKMVRTGLCEIQLKTDVLATYKSDIGGTSLYVLRSSQSYNGYISDNYYVPTANSTSELQLQDPDTVPYIDFNSGYYLLSVMGRGNSAGGSEFVYQLTPAQFKAVIESVYVNMNAWQPADVVSNVIQAFGGNPQKLISGAVWVPYSLPSVASSVVIGGYNTGVSGEILTQPVVDLATFTYYIPKHPKAATKGKYLNTAPFTEYTLCINCGGIVQLDTSKLVDVSEIYVYRTLDKKGTLQTMVQSIASGHAYTHALIYGQMGVPISLDGNNSGGGTISAIVGSVAGVAVAAATGGTAAIAGAAVAGIGSVVSAISGASSNSSSGSIAGVGEPGKLCSTFYDIPAEDNTHQGRPYCQVTTPATLGGFMIVSRGDVDINGTLPEQLEIKRYLESGFYYE